MHVYLLSFFVVAMAPACAMSYARLLIEFFFVALDWNVQAELFVVL